MGYELPTPDARLISSRSQLHLWKVNHNRIAKVQVQLEKFRGRKFQLSEVAQVARIPLDKKSLDNLQDDLRVLIALGIVKLELVNGVVHYSLTQTIGETK